MSLPPAPDQKGSQAGAQGFQQCAGFLRVPESKSVLDNTAVHPESYDAAKALLELTGHTLADVKNGAISDLPARLGAYGEEKAAEEIGVGVPTAGHRIRAAEPGRDVRDELPKPILRTDVLEMKDLKPGMILTGTVRTSSTLACSWTSASIRTVWYTSRRCVTIHPAPLRGGVRGGCGEGGRSGGGREEKAHQPFHEAGEINFFPCKIQIIRRVGGLLAVGSSVSKSLFLPAEPVRTL